MNMNRGLQTYQTMKTNIVYVILFCCMSFICKAQSISGEINPCAEIPYVYYFNGSASSGTINFTVEDGNIISRGEGSITVKWQNKVINGGRWKISVNYFDPQLNQTMQFALGIKVKATTSFTISGDKEIEYGYRGQKKYSASPVSAGYPASYYNWQTNTGINITTDKPTVNINFTDDDIDYIMVRGKNSTCESWGASTALYIQKLVEITGPSSICTSGIYSSKAGGTMSIENSNGTATLQNIGNGQFKLSRVGDGNVTLLLNVENNQYRKVVKVGSNSHLGTIKISPKLMGIGTFNVEFIDSGNDFNTVTEWSIYSSTNDVQISPNGPDKAIIKVNTWNYDQISANSIRVTISGTTSCGTPFSRELAIAGGGSVIDPD